MKIFIKIAAVLGFTLLLSACESIKPYKGDVCAIPQGMVYVTAYNIKKISDNEYRYNVTGLPAYEYRTSTTNPCKKEYK